MKNPGFDFDETYGGLPEEFFSRVMPEKALQPEVAIFNRELAGELGLDFSHLTPEDQAALLSGNVIPEATSPMAQAYAGHQFGHFTMLGDGRAIVLGEHRIPGGGRVDIQFKGSGRTPYSRRGDGRAALGPMLREYLISEAMHGLGIPTTRSLAVVKTGVDVARETLLPGAVLTRVAASHIRVGTFEFAAALGKKEHLEKLLGYTAQRHFPEVGQDSDQPIAQSVLQAFMHRQIALVVDWMRVGFIHGVMNTDNMALSGETIDYGPCAFMDSYNPATVFSSIDHQGRYAYGNQPLIIQWNLARFAETLLPLIDPDTGNALTLARGILESFEDIYRDQWMKMMRNKLGLLQPEDSDHNLIDEFLQWMQQNKADYTNTFIHLTNVSDEFKPHDPLLQCSEFDEWKKRFEDRRSRENSTAEARDTIMRKSNPLVIPRNHLVEQALDAATLGNSQPLMKLLEVLKNPYQSREDMAWSQSPAPADAPPYRTYCGT